jgi:hypothetical protein
MLPFIRRNGFDNKAGFYVTFPVSYKKSLRITVRWTGSPKLTDERVWNDAKKCKQDRSTCEIKTYYAVTANKLVHGAKLRSNFQDYIPRMSTEAKTRYLARVTEAVSKMANSPEIYAPGIRSDCKLTCKKVLSGSETVIYNVQNSAKVIQSLFLRLYDIKKGKLDISKNWKRVLITMTWDGKDPQVNEIPLAGLFITGLDFIREVKSLTTGLRNMTCNIQGDRTSEIAPNDWTAYLFYEMPFWKSAKISVKIPNSHESAIICSQIFTKELFVAEYHPHLTGYFSAQLHQQGFDLIHHKTILHLENQWGHVVALNFFLQNKRIPSTQELDIIIETDEANVPVYSGTGLEDFFYYIHDFQGNRNMTSLFNGAPFYYHKGGFRILRCYRHMLFDPILFTTGIRIYLESMFTRSHPPFRKFLPTSSSFNQTILPDSLFTVVLYYGGKGTGGIATDKIDYYAMINNLPPTIHFSPPSVDTFPVRSMFENQPGIVFNRMVVSISPGQRVTHTLKISKNNVGIILRREYRSVVPNQKAEVKVDGEDVGLWFCSQRALTENFSLRLNDYLLPPVKTAGKDTIEVTLVAITRWETISVQVLSVIITN